MGLAERRAAAEFEKTMYPAIKQSIVDAAGFEVPVDVDWPSLSKDGIQDQYKVVWPKVYFEPLIVALKNICIDDMGKEALKGALKGIKILNSKDNSSATYWATFDGGTITLEHDPYCNVNDSKDRAASLQKLLESKL